MSFGIQNPNGLSMVAALTSWFFRLFAYIFLRWIPGHHFPPILYTLMAVYMVTFVCGLFGEPFELETSYQPIQRDKKGRPVKKKQSPKPASLRDHVFTLLSGVPNPLSKNLGLFNVLINFVIIWMAADMVRSPLNLPHHDLQFTRVGYVSNDSAKIFVRHPFQDVDLKFEFKEATSNYWEDYGTILPQITADTDYTFVHTVEKLMPETSYLYQIGTNLSGTFQTAPSPGKLPSWRNGTFTFLFTSCMKARVPYSPFDHELRIRGLEYLSEWIPKLNPSFMLFLGDFIYIDVPSRPGTDVESYRSEYRRVYASPSFSDAIRNLPWLHVIDDHEIANDWDGNTTGVYAAAYNPFHYYHANPNPHPVVDFEPFYSFVQGPASFFMLETRRYRSPESSDIHNSQKTMLGAQQLQSLLHWIRTSPPQGVRFMVVASSVPFTRNWRLTKDTWGTYLHERQIILDAMHEASAKYNIRFIVISGDRHEAAAVRFRDPNPQRRGDVFEFSVSPLSMFYLPVKTFWHTDDRESTIKYSPDGNFKWGTMEITQSFDDPQESILKFRLFKSGKETWTYTLSNLPHSPLTPNS